MLGVILFSVGVQASNRDGGGGLVSGQIPSQGLRPVLASVASDPNVAEMAPGAELTIDVVVEDVVDLYGYEVHMSFDPSVVHLEDGDSGSPGLNTALGGFLSPVFVAQNTISNTLGTLDVAVTQTGAAPRSGSGTLFSIKVRAVAPGDAGFQFDEVRLANNDALEIPLTTVAPQITVADGSATATHTATATNTATATLTPTPTNTDGPEE
ncbi:MAG: hypothetical protein JXA74_07740, partial [Anaerolineae bacterium]|nr:hypothetical protein [Anaerolineae bacterium]